MFAEASIEIFSKLFSYLHHLHQHIIRYALFVDNILIGFENAL